MAKPLVALLTRIAPRSSDTELIWSGKGVLQQLEGCRWGVRRREGNWLISTRREVEVDNAFAGHALHYRGLGDRGNRIFTTSASPMKPLGIPASLSVGCRIYPVTVWISFGVYQVLSVMPPLHVVLFLEVLPVLFAMRKTHNAVVKTFLLACTSIGRPV